MFKAFAEGYHSQIWIDTPLINKDYAVDLLPLIGGCPCPGIETVEYEGQIYNTVQIGEQCWLKENLNVGQGIAFFYEQTDNGIIEKYCFNEDCSYGGLYTWNEMMKYRTEPYIRGICPEGWHIPTHQDWKMLEGTIDSYYNVDDAIWDSSGYRGFDAGKRMKSDNGWISNGNGTDNFRLSVLPSGYLEGTWDHFYDQNRKAYIWTSDEYKYREFSFDKNGVGKSEIGNPNDEAFSVRCVRKIGELTVPLVVTDSLVEMYQTTARVNAQVIDDGGESVTQRGICIDTEPMPEINDDVFISGYGIGVYRSKAKYLLPNTTYYLRAYARNNIGFGYGNEVQFTTLDTIDGNPCPWATTVVDADSNLYNTVLIGEQCWMKENLKVGRTIANTDMTNNDTIERYCYNNDEANCEIYGGLYQLFEAMNYSTTEGVQGICPKGWHLPTDDEWKELEGKVDSIFGIGDQVWDDEGFRGYDVGKRLKSKIYWDGIDSHGFDALPAGKMDYDFAFSSLFTNTNYITSRRGCNGVVHRKFISNTDSSGWVISDFKSGNSIRCIKD